MATQRAGRARAAAPPLILPAVAVGFFWGMGVMALAGLVAAMLILLSQRMTGRIQ